ncbi:hypothetical protein JOC54_003291 [Alkalihalobacillus xiaoxiensis]|uniref:Uncharacterized protein n=1 Tax=Shouchella xiaoxiensis TaxID=766895 RepID=A0ABS2SY98_9BACI|nr:hypothetical protein [Shouchella xiaoxiensis]MBM7840011.1 hypothetical protein [Shouchella xiaoxiensis]
MDNNNDQKIIVGLWITAIGTIFSAIATTQRVDLVEATRSSYSIYGNALEAGGNALIADGLAEVSPEKTGTYIQTVGNLTVLYADIAPVPDEKEITLNIQGAFLEALGTSYALFGTESPQNPSRFEVISIYSAFLQLFGNVIEGIGGIIELKGGDGEPIFEIGTILQAIGAVITALFYEGSGNRF